MARQIRRMFLKRSGAAGLTIVVLLCLIGPAPAGEPAGNGAALPEVYGYRAPDIDALRERFADPPREAGPWVYWFWFENVVTKEEITREIEEMADAGIAGAELRCITMHGFAGRPGPWFDAEGWARLGHKKLEYLSDEFLDVLEHTFNEARRVGLKMAINLGMGWPPGGPWITDEHRSKHLVARGKIVEGPKRLEGDEASVPPGAMVFAWRVEEEKEGEKGTGPICRDGPKAGTDAQRWSSHKLDLSPFPPRVVVESFRDLSGSVDRQHRLSWNVPEGRWLIGTFHYTFGGICDKGNGPEADPGSREAVLFHLDHLFGRLEPRLAGHFGSTLIDVASDSWEYTPSREGRHWSPALFDTFPAVKGYDLEPRMHALLGYGPDRDRLMRDLDEVERETIRRNFYGTVTEYLNARGLRHRPQVRGEGLPRDFFEAFATADVPEIEEEVYLPEAVWVAHTLGKPIVSAEALTFLSGHARNLTLEGQQQHGGPLVDPRRKWTANPSLIRRHLNAHFARGINRIQIHSFSYSPPGVPAPGWRMYAEIHLNRNCPWWGSMPELSRWIARNQLVLQSGGPVADAVVYPVRSNPESGPYNTAANQPVSAVNAVDAASRYTFPRLKKRDGDVPYDFRRLVLLDDVATLPEARHLLKLIDGGVTLDCSKRMPREWSALRVEGDEKRAVESLRARFAQAGRAGKIVDRRADGWQAALADAGSVRWTPEAAKLTFQHRRVRGGEVYFLMNWSDDFQGRVSFPHASLEPEIWNAHTGETSPAQPYHVLDGRTEVPVLLARLQSTIVVFSAKQPAE